MDYILVKEADEKWDIGTRAITLHCNNERISGAVKMGNTWLILKAAEKPKDGRRKKENSANDKVST